MPCKVVSIYETEHFPFFIWHFGGGRWGGGGGRFTADEYKKYVSELPATGITSAGHILWQTTYSDFSPESAFNGDLFPNYPKSGQSAKFDLLSGDIGFHIATYRYTNWNFSFDSCSLFCPISGFYRLTDSAYMSYSRFSLDSGYSDSGVLYYSLGSYSYCSVDALLSFGMIQLSIRDNMGSGVYDVYFPIYEIIPDSAIDTSAGGQYSITTRPTAITGGNYGIVGDDGTINTVTNNNQIINETNNNYCNPATGQTCTITDWTYNYDDRIYTITLDTGDKVSVEYGDENITITENNVVEGDTIINNYTIYYIIDGSGSGDNPDPSPSPDLDPIPSVCPHIWQETGRTDPACTSPGKADYICTKCHETKTEILKATGHTWQVLRTVQTSYDEEGNLVQQGYTIYQCAVCAEQYKDTQGTGPPGGSSGDDEESIWDKIGNFIGSIFEGILGMIEAVVSKILDGLIALGEMLMEKLTAVVETVLTVFDEIPRLFGGFLDFLGIVFPYIPSEITLLLTFGIIAVTFIGIIKALRR